MFCHRDQYVVLLLDKRQRHWLSIFQHSTTINSADILPHVNLFLYDVDAPIKMLYFNILKSLYLVFKGTGPG